MIQQHQFQKARLIQHNLSEKVGGALTVLQDRG